MAGQGQLATQQASASIGAQEARIQQLRAGEASRLQTLERQGEQYAEGLRLSGAETARGLEYSKTGTLLGMSQQRTAAANQARRMAAAQQMGAVGDIASAGLGLATSGIDFGGGGGVNATDRYFKNNPKAIGMSESEMLEMARKNALGSNIIQNS
jgi:hypothetical protein